jgi:hypothetical protein
MEWWIAVTKRVSGNQEIRVRDIRKSEHQEFLNPINLVP